MKNLIIAYFAALCILSLGVITPAGGLMIDCLRSFGMLAYAGGMYLAVTLVAMAAFLVLCWLED